MKMDAARVFGAMRHYEKMIDDSPPDEMPEVRQRIKAAFEDSGYTVVEEQIVPRLLQMAEDKENLRGDRWKKVRWVNR